MEDMLSWVQGAEAHVEASSSAEPLPPPPGLQRQLQHRGDIDRAVREGRVSRTQAKKLKKTIKRLQTEYIEAYEAGQDMEIWLQRVQVDDDNGMADILAFGDKLRDKPSKPDPALIGAPDQKYLRIRNGITMDSGCSVFVVPSDWLQMFPLEESEGSRNCQAYTAAAKDGKPIYNEGQKLIKFTTSDGQKKKVLCQVAKVNKILASIAGICDHGNHVLFREDGGDIINQKTFKKTSFKRLGNIYVLDAWIINPCWQGETDDIDMDEPEMMDFTRQGS
jgi:hypothetical protein